MPRQPSRWRGYSLRRAGDRVLLRAFFAQALGSNYLVAGPVQSDTNLKNVEHTIKGELFMKTTILNGMLLLAPLAVIVIILEKLMGYARLIAKPMEQFYPLDRVVGVILANVIAAAMLLALCYVIGIGAKKNFLGGALRRLDAFFFDSIPGYAVIKGTFIRIANTDEQASSLIPVLVRFDDYEQIAFEIERIDDRVAVFLPGSPSAWSGSSIIVSADRVEGLNIPFMQATALLRTMGHGSLAKTSDVH